LGSLVLIPVGCEDGDGNALVVEPANATIGTNVATFTLTVVRGTHNLSFPLQWTVEDDGLGSIEPVSDYSAVYTRTASNGVNTVTVIDRHGGEGVASVEQVDSDTPQPPTPQEPVAPAPPAAQPSVGDVSGNRVIILNAWADGSAATVELPIGAGVQNFMNLQDGFHPGEILNLQFSNITWTGAEIGGFNLLVNGTAALTHP